MSRYQLTLAAQNDLLELASFIRQDNLAAARRVMVEVRRTLNRLVDSPGLGHRREDLTTEPTLRFWPIYSYLIVYRSETKPLEILRVLHGARDVQALLSRPQD